VGVLDEDDMQEPIAVFGVVILPLALDVCSRNGLSENDQFPSQESNGECVE